MRFDQFIHSFIPQWFVFISVFLEGINQKKSCLTKHPLVPSVSPAAAKAPECPRPTPTTTAVIPCVKRFIDIWKKIRTEKNINHRKVVFDINLFQHRTTNSYNITNSNYNLCVSTSAISEEQSWSQKHILVLSIFYTTTLILINKYGMMQLQSITCLFLPTDEY